jgi:ankyrin repeat protein
LKRIVRFDPTALRQADEKGWLPLHVAVMQGYVEAAQVILSTGGDINQVAGTGVEAGVSPLDIAHHFLGNDHEMTNFLRENGAIHVLP